MSNATTIDLVAKNDKVKSTLNATEDMLKAFGGKVLAGFAVIGAAMAGQKLFEWGAGFVQAASESAEAEAKLAQVLKATGGAAGYTKEQLVALSEQLQETTKYEAEVTQGAMAILATFRNVRGDVFIDATKAAQDMATVLGTDVNGAAMQLGKALNDPVAGIKALTRAGVSFTEQQEELISKLVESGDVIGAQKMILEELQHEFGGAAEAVGQTFAGKLEQLRNRFGDMAESLGAVIIDALNALMPVIEGIAAFLENLIPIIEEVANGFAIMASDSQSYLSAFFDWVVDAAVTCYTGLEWVFSNIGKIAELGFKAMAYAGTVQVETLKYWFTELLPSYLQWFGDNWLQILQDMNNFQGTILTNMGKNIWNFIGSVKDALKGKGFDFKFTSLLEGFELTMDELPTIADRKIGETEKQLGKDIDRLKEELGADFGDRFNANRDSLLSMFKKQEKDAIDMSHKADLSFDPEAFTTKGKEEKEKKATAKASKADEAPVMEDLLALNKRIQDAAGTTPEEELKDATEDLIDVNKDLIDTLKERSSPLDVVSQELNVSIEDDFAKALAEFGDTIGGFANTQNTSAIVSDIGTGGAMFDEMADAAALPDLSVDALKVSDSFDSVRSLVEETRATNTLLASLVELQSAGVDATKEVSENVDSVGRLF